MRMLFISLPGFYDFSTYTSMHWDIYRLLPIGVISLMSYLHSKGHNVELVDGSQSIYISGSNNYIQNIFDAINSFRPDLVGINMLSQGFKQAKAVASEVKSRYPNLFIIAGGVHPSVEPELTLRQISELDAVCVGPGEEPLLELLQGASPTGITGIMVRGYDHLFKKRHPEMDIDRYPFPNYSLVNHEYYSAWSAGRSQFGWLSRNLFAMTSRSCSNVCKFCASEWSKPLRMHSPEYVVEIVRYLSTFNIDSIAFFDDSIANDLQRIHEICDLLIQSRLCISKGRLRWSAAIRAPHVTPDLLRHMKEAGCYFLSIGCESGSDRILRLIGKGSTVELNRRALRAIQDSRLDAAASFMIGVPTETEDEALETLKFMQEMDDLHVKGIGCFHPLPRSPFYTDFIQRGIIDREKIDWENLGNFSIIPVNNMSKIPDQRLNELFLTGSEIANRICLAVHPDVLNECPKGLVDTLEKSGKLRVFSTENIREEPGGLRNSLIVNLQPQYSLSI